MPKRQRCGGDDRNPLSSARKDAGSGRSKNGRNVASTKADRAARSLWHRKSGAGYHLFVSYYGSQPRGVVVPDVDDVGDDADPYPALNERKPRDGMRGGGADESDDGARGMSRAAKKRRRRKSKANACGADDSPEKTSNRRHKALPDCGEDDAMTTSPRPLTEDSSHPLLQAFASKKNEYPRLTPFLRALSRPLPLTLRFREHRPQSKISADLKRTFSKEHSHLLLSVSYDPSKSIYQAAPNSSLCKSNLGKLSPELKERIVDGSTNGALARQELGSMLPVLCLRAVGAVRGGSKVLDLCASPGSKTLQALEIVGVGSGGGGGGKRGRVIANDVHSGRLDALRDAVLRSGLPESLTSRVTYTNHDASVFPPPKSGRLFDAIICDVPCGGDGTIRKDKHILPMWSPDTSNALHGLQLKILRRALALVKVGGVVCYSTCSLNPIEDEAVVSAALGSEGGGDDDGGPAFELLDWPEDALPGFVRRPGVALWKVAFYDQNDVEHDEDDGDFGSLSFFESYERAREAGTEGARPSFWPDGERNARLGLRRCTRLLPQDQDTGGFFIALIKRMR